MKRSNVLPASGPEQRAITYGPRSPLGWQAVCGNRGENSARRTDADQSRSSMAPQLRSSSSMSIPEANYKAMQAVGGSGRGRSSRAVRFLRNRHGNNKVL